MTRPRLAAGLTAVIASLVAAHPVLAAPPPTLTGEQFDSFGGPAPVPVPMSVDCVDNPDGTATISWETVPRPTTAGPYDGNFTERGQMRVEQREEGEFFTDVLSLSAEFTIESSIGQVSGTKRLTAPVADAVAYLCDPLIVDTNPLSVAYNATTTTPQGVFADRGQAVHNFDDQGPNPASFTELNEDFTSSLSATEQQGSVLLGKRTLGASFSAMSANTKRASPFTLYFPATVRKVHAFLDGGGATSGNQLVRAVLYRNTAQGPGAYVTRSFEFTVPAGMSPRWVQFYLAPTAQLQPGVYWLGLHSGHTHQVARYAWHSKPNSRAFNADLESDGPSNPFGPALSDNQQISIFASGSY